MLLAVLPRFQVLEFSVISSNRGRRGHPIGSLQNNSGSLPNFCESDDQVNQALLKLAVGDAVQVGDTRSWFSSSLARAFCNNVS